MIKHFSIIGKAVGSIPHHCRKKGGRGGPVTNQGRAQCQEHLYKGLPHHWLSGISCQGSALSGFLISSGHENHLFSSSNSLETGLSLQFPQRLWILHRRKDFVQLNRRNTSLLLLLN